jgi:hypothetical protein
MTTKQTAPPIQNLYFQSVFIFSPSSVPLRQTPYVGFANHPVFPGIGTEAPTES